VGENEQEEEQGIYIIKYDMRRNQMRQAEHVTPTNK
jgi:hypothetical protein